MNLMPPAAARLEAGLTLELAAKRLRISIDYLRQVEREGAPFVLARKMATLYKCRMDLFLPRPKGRQDAKTTRLKRTHAASVCR